MTSNMESLLMGGDDSDSDSDDNSNGVVEVSGGTVPTSAAAAILISNPTIPTTIPAPIPAPVPAPVPAPAPVPVQMNQPISVSRNPIAPNNAPPPSRPLPSSQPPHVNTMQNVSSVNRVHAPSNSHPSASSTSNPMQRTVVSSVNNPVVGVGVGTVDPNSQSASAHQAQQNKLKSLYSSRSAVPPISSHHTAAQHKPYQQQQPIRKPYQTSVSSNPPSSASAPAPVSHPHDPFEPTPLQVIKAKTKSVSAPVSSQQRNNHQMQHMIARQPVQPVQRNPQHNRQHPFRATTTAAATPTSRARTSPAPSSSQQRQQSQSSQPATTSSHEQKSRKERFLMFTRVLMKYLEQKDRQMHGKAKEVIRQCAKKNKEGDPNYASLSASMQSHLKTLVGDIYWKKAEEYLRQYLFGQYSKDGMTHKDAKKKAEEVAKSAAERLPANTPIYPTPAMRQTSKSQTTTTAWPGAQQQAKTTHTQAQVQAQAQAKAAAQRKKNKKKKADAAASAAAAPAQANVAKSSQPVIPTPKSGGGQTNPSGISNTNTGKTTKGKKTSSASRKTSTTTTTTTVQPTQVREPKEYEELMEMLDHVVDYDVTSCVKILGNRSVHKQKNEVNISEEQTKLLYHDFGMSGGPRKGLYGGFKVDNGNLSESSLSQKPLSKIPPYLKGWGTRNIVSSRSAWAKLRLAEDEVQRVTETPLPAVTLSSNVASKPDESNSDGDASTAVLNQNGSDGWLNEEMAEQDEALTLISEATQQFVKTILEGAMNTASKRLNLDGIRLWHQQHTAIDVVAKEVQLNGETLSKRSATGPPLCIRLGCDVKRQYAMVQGNAAKTSQRMEEALSRKSDYKPLNTETMCTATSMTELSKMPQISSAANKAEYNAKRSFEIYGGKDSGDPPLGRVPKQAKILVKDFKVCLSDSAFAMSKNRVSTCAFV